MLRNIGLVRRFGEMLGIRLAVWLLPVLVGMLSGCGDPGVVIQIRDWPLDAYQVQIRFTLDGQPGEPQELTREQSRFVVWLPSGATGILRADLDAIDDNGCKSGSGHIELTVGGLRRVVETAAVLTPLSPKRCTLKVGLSPASPAVVSVPAGIRCGGGEMACEMDFPLGTRVALRPVFAQAGAHPLWSGGCSAVGDCNVVMDRRRTIGGQIEPMPLKCSAGFCQYGRIGKDDYWVAIAGSAPDDVWAGSSSGTLAHWNGRYWTGNDSVTSNAINSLWALDRDHVWAAGNQIFRWDGTAWREQTISSARTYNKFDYIWGIDDANVWAVTTYTDTTVTPNARYSVVLRYDGAVWSEIPGSAKKDGAYSQIWGTSAKNLYVTVDRNTQNTVIRYDGSQWTAQNITAGYTGYSQAIWGADADNIWISGTTGEIFKWNGNSWALQPAYGTDPARNNVTSIWGTSKNDVVAVGSRDRSGVVGSWSGGAGNWRNQKSAFFETIQTVWGTAPNDYWAVGGTSILHFDGSAWSVQNQSVPATDLYSIWGVDADNIWAVGNFAMPLKWNGRNWLPQPQIGIGTGRALNAVHGDSAQSVWAVGAGGRVLNLFVDGNEWVAKGDPFSGNSVTSVWAADASNVWAASDAGQIARYDGFSWRMEKSDGKNFKLVWGTSKDDVWAAEYGFNPGIFRRKNGTWTEEYRYGANDYVYGGSRSSLHPGMLVGYQNLFRTRVDGTWKTNDSELMGLGQHDLYDIWSDDRSGSWLVGANSFIARKRPGETEWKELAPIPNFGSSTYYSIFGTSQDDVWIVGSNGNILRHYEGATLPQP